MDIIQNAVAPRSRSRWRLAYLWTAGLAVYCLSILMGDEQLIVWTNNLAWTIASAVAAAVCYRTALGCDGLRRRAWMLLALGCASWLIGQLHWSYNQLFLGVPLPFPSIGQPFYTGFAVFAIAALLQLPGRTERGPFTFKKLGNVGLVSCCLAVTVALGVLEPALDSRVPPLHLWIALIHTTLVAAVFLTSLYALWTYRWGASWIPMLILTAAASVYAVANVLYAHALLTGSYLPDDLINMSWLVVFGLVAAAAAEQASIRKRRPAPRAARMQARERWLEAVIPALLIIIMVTVAVGGAGALSPRAGYIAAAFFIVFALVLGAREAWIQKEAQELNTQLLAANEQLQAANAELRRSEARYRNLNLELEQRVAERTAQLKQAYDELEGFSYAVAHDLKAPLRAINGFAHLLESELQESMTDAARDQLARIRNGSLKMATLIDDLLAYSHIDRRGLQTSLVTLPGLIESVVTHYADEMQRRCVALQLNVDAITMRIDADGLALALRNLFENALKYTRERTAPRIEISGVRTSAGVRIAFKDNGIGFDMEYHDHIFKIFQRLHRDDRYPGTGIGLALVRKAVERIGGRVWAESKHGEGATFFIELPIAVVERAA